MGEVALTPPTAYAGGAQTVGITLRIAWRNLWRNKRRTWLTSGGIAFATLIVAFAMCTQYGAYQAMIASATGLLEGHIQVSHPDYPEDGKLDQTLAQGTELIRQLDAIPGFEVAPRAATFALISADERSFGGLIVGVDFEREVRAFNFFKSIQEGRLPENEEEIVVGRIMARNLGVILGDELVALGSAKEGGVAAMAQTVVGIFESGQAELDRTMLFARLPAVQSAFELGDEIHTAVVLIDRQDQLERQRARIQEALGSSHAVRTWREYLPDLVQAIEIDRIGGQLMYGAILILVSFSVINTFLMIVFERTREFGMLLAIGMRSSLIVRQVLAEAFFMWVVGVALGLALAIALVGWLAIDGIPLTGMEDVAGAFYISDRIYPAFEFWSLMSAPFILLVGTQIAGLIATFKIRRIAPVEALRGE